MNENPTPPDNARDREAAENETVKEYLEDLGLTIADLHGKRILDVGAGSGAFVRFANAHGAEAMALDNGNNLGSEALAYMEKTKTPFVVADAAHIPFPDNSFDLVVSHAAIPNIANPSFKHMSKEDYDLEVEREQPRRIAALKEMVRVCKPGGRSICGPVVDDLQKLPGQTTLIREAISAISATVETQEEQLSGGSFRLTLNEK